jgi:fructose-1,6-bisphosphatase/inositol monophosphatase family enzyme
MNLTNIFVSIVSKASRFMIHDFFEISRMNDQFSDVEKFFLSSYRKIGTEIQNHLSEVIPNSNILIEKRIDMVNRFFDFSSGFETKKSISEIAKEMQIDDIKDNQEDILNIQVFPMNGCLSFIKSSDDCSISIFSLDKDGNANYGIVSNPISKDTFIIAPESIYLNDTKIKAREGISKIPSISIIGKSCLFSKLTYPLIKASSFVDTSYDVHLSLLGIISGKYDFVVHEGIDMDYYSSIISSITKHGCIIYDLSNETEIKEYKGRTGMTIISTRNKINQLKKAKIIQ